MEHTSPLIKARFIQRYKRFFADIEVDGQKVTAHVPNTGSMKTCLEEGAICYVTHNPDPKRKLKWTLERMEINKKQIGLNTRWPNSMVFEAWEGKLIPHWKKWDRAQSEVKINDKSRLDLALWSSKVHPETKKLSLPFKKPLHFIEIKNVTMAENDTALFPDAVTTRGTKHIEELCELIKQGHTCEMVYVINREGIKGFKIAKDIDPDYFNTLKAAQKLGLKVSALKTQFKPQSLSVSGLLQEGV